MRPTLLIAGVLLAALSAAKTTAIFAAAHKQEPPTQSKMASKSMGSKQKATELVIEADVTSEFDSMLREQRLKLGRNLVHTDASGQKLWADVAKDGTDVSVAWQVTGKQERPVPTRVFEISKASPAPRSEERWLVCTVGTDGKLHCTETKCPVKFPCPKWICG